MTNANTLYQWLQDHAAAFFALHQGHTAQAQDIISQLEFDQQNSLKIFEELLSAEAEINKLTAINAGLLTHWAQGNSPSLFAMISAYCKYQKLQLPPALQQALLSAAFLGSFANENAYHNHMHYKKVVLQAMRLVCAHNNLFDDNPHYSLTQSDIALLLIAACVHDLGHDGKGNTVHGVYAPSRLEAQSINLFMPVLAALDYTEESDEAYAIQAMILGTDVTPINDPANPSNQMKAAYRYHFLGGKDKSLTLNLSPDLQPLEQHRKVALLALLLHEADLGTSAGITYDITMQETIAVGQEVGGRAMHPADIVVFLTDICQRRFLSDAGQKLYSANLARIYARAQQEAETNNRPLSDEAIKTPESEKL